MWPPANPPEDETPKKPITRDRTDSLNTTTVQSELASMAATVQQMAITETALQSQRTQQIFEETSMQKTEIASLASNAIQTTASAMATSTSTKSESVIQSSKSEERHESSCSVQSFSKQKAESQSLTVYQSQASKPIQNSFEICSKKNSQESQITEKAAVHEFPQIGSSSAQNEQISTFREEQVCEYKRSTELKSENTENVKEFSETPETEKENNAEASSETCQNQEIKKESCPIAQTDIESQSKLNVKISASEFEKQSQPTIPKSDIPPIKPLPPSNIPNPIPRGFVCNMTDALTTAPDRPYSPLLAPSAPISSIPSKPIAEPLQEIYTQQDVMPPKLPVALSPIFMQQPKRGITPIPPIKAYNPPNNLNEPIPMPPETKPYIPPDFKIIIEPKVPRQMASSPMVEALTTAPDRPFTPIPAIPNIERCSLKDALTIAPDRSYSPLPLSVTTQSQSSLVTSSIQSSTMQVQSTTSSQIVRPIATQTSTQTVEHTHSEFSSMQNTCKLQSSTEVSAFRPVAKQTFPPPQPEEFCKLTNFPPISDELKSSFQKSMQNRKESTSISAATNQIESKSFQTTAINTSVNTQAFSSVKTAQSFFEQLDKKEMLTSTAVRSKSGLHKPDSIPQYQKHFEQLPSQRGITPEVSFAPAILQRPVTPSTDPPVRPREKSQEPRLQSLTPKPAVVEPQKAEAQQPPVYFHKDTPISMTFQPVTDENFLRVSPVRSRPNTPSLINKPAPIIPYYQMNLVTVEHLAPDSNMFNPSSPETSRSPTPKLRSRSPAQGPPTNPLKAHAPRIKENTSQRNAAHTLLTQATSNLRKEHEMSQKDIHSNIEVFNASGAKHWGQDQHQPSVIKEQRLSNVGYASENYEREGFKIKEDSMMKQNSGQKSMQSQNVEEYGNTIIQSSRKTYEEFESTQSAKVIEIRKGASSSSSHCQQFDSNHRPSAINPKQVFPPPASVSSSQQSSSVNISNQNVTSASREIRQPNPMTSGANQSPACDPTPSTGPSVGGGSGRGKTFGVSSAPKRGRGVLNKAAVPGSRVPLCGHCNGNIR